MAPGDHLYPWVDIEVADMVGAERDDRAPPILRKTTSKIPSVRKAFNKILNDEIDTRELYGRAESLIEAARARKKLTAEEKSEYEIIEGRMRRAVKFADNSCRKARVGKVPFSPQQKKLMGRIFILRLILLRHKLRGRSGRPHFRRIKREAKKYNYIREQPVSRLLLRLRLKSKK